MSTLNRQDHRLIRTTRRKGAERDGREGQGQGTTECRTARHQKVWEEIMRMWRGVDTKIGRRVEALKLTRVTQGSHDLCSLGRICIDDCS